MKIRQAEISDLSALIELAGVLGYEFPGYEYTEDYLLSNLAELLADESHILLVAEEGGKVAGYVEGAVYRSILVPKSIRVMGIAVLPHFQDKGVGGKLLTALEVEVKSRGYRQINLTSGEQRHLAHDFYRKHGYVGDHKQIKFWKDLAENE